MQAKDTAQRIRAARAYAGLTLQDLAARVGLGRNTLIRMESGEREAKRMELRELAAATELPYEFFTTDLATIGQHDVAEFEDRLTRIETTVQELLRLAREWEQRQGGWGDALDRLEVAIRNPDEPGRAVGGS